MTVVIYTNSNDNKVFKVNENEGESTNYIKYKLKEIPMIICYYLLLKYNLL